MSTMRCRFVANRHMAVLACVAVALVATGVCVATPTFVEDEPSADEWDMARGLKGEPGPSTVVDLKKESEPNSPSEPKSESKPESESEGEADGEHESETDSQPEPEHEHEHEPESAKAEGEPETNDTASAGCAAGMAATAAVVLLARSLSLLEMANVGQ